MKPSNSCSLIRKNNASPRIGAEGDSPAKALLPEPCLSLSDCRAQGKVEANFSNTQVALFSHSSGMRPRHVLSCSSHSSSHVQPRGGRAQNGALGGQFFRETSRSCCSPRHSGWASVPPWRWLVGPAGVSTGGLFQLVQEPGPHRGGNLWLAGPRLAALQHTPRKLSDAHSTVPTGIAHQAPCTQGHKKSPRVVPHACCRGRTLDRLDDPLGGPLGARITCPSPQNSTISLRRTMK